MTYEDFARALVERAQVPLFFEEAAKLVPNRFQDIGPIPTTGDPEAAMREVVQTLPSVREPFHFGRLVFYAGYLAEKGASIMTAAALVAETLPWFVSCAALAAKDAPDEQDIPKLAASASERYPDAASAILVVELALTGVMTLFCRDRPALRLARKSSELLVAARALGGNVIVAHFLAQLLTSSDQQRLLVVQPAARRAFSVIADGVRNGYHLFVLLEAALFGSDGRGKLIGPPISPEDVEIARGTRPLTGERVMRAHLDYFNWSAWDGTNWLPDAPTRWIWGELPLTSIPELHGWSVVLIEAPRYERSWDARLACALHPDHRPDVIIEDSLPDHQVSRWLEIIAAAPAEARTSLRYAGVTM